MDFYDKLFISIVSVIVTLLCLFNVFVFAYENLEYITISNLTIDVDSNTFKAQNGSILGYYPLEKGFTYTITIPENWSQDRRVALSSEVPSPGTSLKFLSYIKPGESYSYSCYDDSEFMYIDFSSANQGLILTRTPITGLKSAVESLVDNVGVNNIWNTFEISLPYVGVVVLVGFGFYLIFHNIKEISNGKENM